MARPAFITRFAPSPTGYAHRGHAFSALTAFAAAQRAGGRFLLRIEDIDTERCRPEFEAAFYDDLAWLGLTWERPVRRQSEHLADYAAALESLKARNLVYRSYKTRRETQEPAAPEPDRDYAWRLSLDRALRVALMPDDFRPDLVGDVVLTRKGLGAAYHLAVVVDDALQGVTHVIRGADLVDATPIHRLLQALLELPTPQYVHHPLILRDDGKKYSKRDTTETLRDIRARGVTAATLRAELGF